jgi:predicted ester cyclase
MSEKLKALSKQWFEKVWNQQDESAIDQLAAPDVIAHGLTSGGEHFDGTSPFLKFYRPFVSAFPNLHIAVEDVIAEGDKTVVRIRFTGKHTGDGLGIAPTGNNVSVTGAGDDALARREDRRSLERIRRRRDVAAIAGTGEGEDLG